jgi:hypothetical protein
MQPSVFGEVLHAGQGHRQGTRDTPAEILNYHARWPWIERTSLIMLLDIGGDRCHQLLQPMHDVFTAQISKHYCAR